MNALFAVSASGAWAAPLVTSCLDDDSGGTLREAVAGAASGDTIDMSGLTTGAPGCSTSEITLTTGAIVVAQDKLTLKGGGRNSLHIKAAAGSRVIVQDVVAGHLYLESLSVEFGNISGSGNVYGGCVATLKGALTLTNVGVHDCSATTTGLSTDMPLPHAYGGGVFAANGLTIADHSVLGNNTVVATNADVRAQGGCAMTSGPFSMSDSIVTNCSANGPVGGARVRGGGLELRGSSAIISRSVISRNYSTYIVGGVDMRNGTATVSNSTITLNDAHYLIGGLYANSGQVTLANSTFVSNTAGQYTYTYNANTYNAAPGVSITNVGGTFSLQSTIIAGNSANGVQEDLSINASGLTFAASNNLVRAYKGDVTLPAGQGNLAKGTCPLLGSLRDNGGGTYTLAPQSGSPVIDAGNNTANDPDSGLPALYDQRNQGSVVPLYERVSGPAADIGAHEVQKSDIVFYTEFDTGCS